MQTILVAKFLDLQYFILYIDIKYYILNNKYHIIGKQLWHFAVLPGGACG